MPASAMPQCMLWQLHTQQSVQALSCNTGRQRINQPSAVLPSALYFILLYFAAPYLASVPLPSQPSNHRLIPCYGCCSPTPPAIILIIVIITAVQP
jgi:hypothetical protein